MIQIQEHYIAGVGQPQPPIVAPPAITPPGAQAAPQTRVVNGVQELSKDVADYTLIALASMYLVVPAGVIQTPDLQTYYMLSADQYAALSGQPASAAPQGLGTIIESGGIGPTDPNSPRIIIDLGDLARWSEQGIADQMLVMVARTRELAAGVAEPGSQYAVIAPLEGGAVAGATARRRSAAPIIIGGIALAAIAAALA